MRVDDEVIREFLTWARTYEDIAYWEHLPGGGRCWRIVLVEREEIGSHPDPAFPRLPEQVVPTEMVLTAREALVFGYGLAVAGVSRDRREWTDEDFATASERVKARLAARFAEDGGDDDDR